MPYTMIFLDKGIEPPKKGDLFVAVSVVDMGNQHCGPVAYVELEPVKGGTSEAKVQVQRIVEILRTLRSGEAPDVV